MSLAHVYLNSNAAFICCLGETVTSARQLIHDPLDFIAARGLPDEDHETGNNRDGLGERLSMTIVSLA